MLEINYVIDFCGSYFQKEEGTTGESRGTEVHSSRGRGLYKTCARGGGAAGGAAGRGEQQKEEEEEEKKEKEEDNLRKI